MDERHREALVGHIARMMAPDFEPRIGREGTATVVTAHRADDGGATFSVHVSPRNGGLSIGIVRGEDNVVDGLPHDWPRKRPVKDRCFLQHPRDERAKQEFTAALKREVAETRERHERGQVEDAAGVLGARLQDLVNLDPDNAGDAIADVLRGMMDAYGLREVTERVQQAHGEAIASRP